MSGEHGRRALAGTDKPVGDQRGICRETDPVWNDRAKPVLAARNPFDSIVMRRSTQVTLTSAFLKYEPEIPIRVYNIWLELWRFFNINLPWTKTTLN